MSCKVIHHPAPSSADTAFLAGDFAKAADLYKTALAQNPGQADAAIGLVHSLLRQQRVIDAANEVQTTIGEKSAPPELLTLRGEVELRQGEPWTAGETASASAKLDPCNPRTLFLISRLARLNSKNAAASRFLASAHTLDPEDAEIRAAWMDGLPSAGRIPELEAYLAAPRGDDAEAVTERRVQLEQLKKLPADLQPTCALVSKPTATEVPFSAVTSLRTGGASWPAFEVNVNAHKIQLAIDTGYNARLPIEGVSGLLILESTAKHLGLKPLYQLEVPGIGPQGPRGGFIAFADSISIGGIEFHNCAVQVINSKFAGDVDGVISMSLMSDFLVTIDYPSHKFAFDPLPALPTGKPANGVSDRYIAPEMSDYTEIYRSGSDLLLPVLVNNKYLRLFLLDTSIGVTMLSPEAAHEIAEGHKDSKYEVRDTSGKVDYQFTACGVSLSFARTTQKFNCVSTFDTSRFTRDSGMAISGFLGDESLQTMKVQIDYRDGLIKLDSDSKRKK
ncbi:MAG TPA: tetratricopeptide repeat protein [Terracidiphilus sp.]